MYISILTHERATAFSANYINYLYPANRLFKSCVELRMTPELQKIPNSNINDSSLAGPLRKLPNDINGEKRLHALKQQIDRNQNYRATKSTDRLHWSNKPVIPSRVSSSLAPILPSTTASTGMKVNSGRAMALGMVLQKGRSMLLYDIIRQNVKALAMKIQSSHPGSSGCVLVANIKYLKVEREYGKAPQLSRITLDHVIDRHDVHNFDSNAHIRDRISTLCEVSAKSPVKTKYQVTIGEYDNSYSTAILFLKCEWE